MRLHELSELQEEGNDKDVGTYPCFANMRSKEMSLGRFLAQIAVARIQSDSQDSASLSCVEDC